MKKIKLSYISIAGSLLAVLQLLACSQGKPQQDYSSPPGYDFSKPRKWKMPEELLEISGIAFDDGNADTMYAEEDEDGKLYRFHPGDEQVTHTKFGKQGDYEDIAILHKQVFILKSNGKIYRFPLDSIKQKRIENVQEFKSILPEGEYEGMYADAAASQLLVLCKNCSGEKKSAINTIYKLSYRNDTLQQAGEGNIDVEQIAMLAGKGKIRFKPSALAKNPVTGQWYILSSFNKILVAANPQWQVTSVYHLEPGLFLQPEGIAFDRAGNLYISNEGDELSAGNVLLFPYLKQHSKH